MHFTEFENVYTVMLGSQLKQILQTQVRNIKRSQKSMHVEVTLLPGMQSRSRHLGLETQLRQFPNVSVSCHRVSFTSQYAELFASLQNCTYIVLNAMSLYCLRIHKLQSHLHPLCCTHLQLHCSAQFKKKSLSLTLLMQNLTTSSVQSQLSEARLPQCRVETESPKSLLTHRCSVRVLDCPEYSVHALMVSVALY